MKNNTKNSDTSNNNISKKALYELFLNINDKLTHLEDATIDNRALIAKLVKQGNTIVEFLKQFDIQEVDPVEFGVEESMPDFFTDIDERSNKLQSVKELVDEYIERYEDLKEFEEELKKHKKHLVPGQMGES